jgi:hypothetical protein
MKADRGGAVMTNMRQVEIMSTTDATMSRNRPEAVTFGWLSLAASPSFALMALVTGLSHNGGADMLCSAAHGPWSIGGMAPMYLLMSVFHAAPWLKLAAQLLRSRHSSTPVVPARRSASRDS